MGISIVTSLGWPVSSGWWIEGGEPLEELEVGKLDQQAMLMAGLENPVDDLRDVINIAV
jgi:hypothetical protein